MSVLACTDLYDVLGHIIYPLRYMHTPVSLERYRETIRTILRKVVEGGRGIEINTYRGRTIADWRPILELYRDCGGEIVTVRLGRTPAGARGAGDIGGLCAAAADRLPLSCHL